MEFSTYIMSIVINGHQFKVVEIDSHYLESHSEHMNDALILRLVREINGHYFTPVFESEERLKVIVVKPIYLDQVLFKPYKLVLYYYLGEHRLTVRTAFRIRR